jgi:hypothetical protein
MLSRMVSRSVGTSLDSVDLLISPQGSMQSLEAGRSVILRRSERVRCATTSRQTDELTNELAVHNSFARSDPYHLEEARKATEDDDAYHFIAYLPVGDKLFELDGLKPSPVSHGIIPGGPDNWTAHAKECVLSSEPPAWPAALTMESQGHQSSDRNPSARRSPLQPPRHHLSLDFSRSTTRYTRG